MPPAYNPARHVPQDRCQQVPEVWAPGFAHHVQQRQQHSQKCLGLLHCAVHPDLAVYQGHHAPQHILQQGYSTDTRLHAIVSGGLWQNLSRQT
eukprot:1155968-Pelagomonas_calceolata.AAC.1